MRRSGFALLTVLLALAGVSVAALAVGVAARRTLAATMNQIAADRAYWAAEACSALMLDAATRFLTGTPVDLRDPQRTWRGLDTRVGMIARDRAGVGSCTASLQSNGARLDVNRASGLELRRLLAVIGVPPIRGDSLAAALLDWRDPDNRPRAPGAEASWYRAHHREAPRNGPIAAIEEVHLIRGFSALSAGQRAELDTLLGTETSRIDLWHAPLAVLLTLPGFSPDVAGSIIALRRETPGVAGIPQLLSVASQPVRDSIDAHYAELIPQVATGPTEWVLMAQGYDTGAAPIRVHMELLLGFGGGRAAVLRRRYWLQ